MGSISILYPCLCSVNEGIVTSGGLSNYLDSYKTHYEDIDTCWEINLPPSANNQIEDFIVTTSGMPSNYWGKITSPITLIAGALHTITWTVNNEGAQSRLTASAATGRNSYGDP